MYSLQASYLDFGLNTPRPMLEENIVSIWPEDIWVHRPQSPELMMPLLALWGPLRLDRPGFANALSELSLRSLMAVMSAGALFHSAVLGLEAVGDQAQLEGLALGACNRYFGYLARGMTLKKGFLDFGGDPVRYVPTGADDEFCRKRCCTKKGPGAQLSAHCPLFVVLDKMRRFAAFHEENDGAS